MTKRCPVCQQSKDAADFIAGLCLDCFGSGARIPLGPLETAEDEERRIRAQRRMGRQGATSGDEAQHDEPKEGEAMSVAGKLRECRYCGKEMAEGSLWRHEHVMCEKRTTDGEPVATVHAKLPMKRKTKKALESVIKTVQENHSKSAANGCTECLFRGLERHIDQDLVRRAILGGMAMDVACGFVRDVRAALGR